jgi:hypothetical protein
MGIVLLGMLVGLPLLMLLVAALWDRNHRRETGHDTTVTRQRRRLADTIAATSVEGMAVAAKTRGAGRRQNYGDLGKR